MRKVAIATVGLGLLLLVGGDIAERERLTYAQLMNLLTETRYAPIYSPLARQIVRDTGVTQGICLDLGCGPGGLSVALAEETDLRVYGVDIDPEAIRFGVDKVRGEGLADRVHILWGDATSLPFKEGFADLVVSRGMMPPMGFPLKVKVFREAWRVLKPGGVAYLGGGFGRLLPYKLAKGIVRKSFKAQRLPDLCLDRKTWERALRRAGIRRYCFVYDRYGEETFGMWVMFRKPKFRQP